MRITPNRSVPRRDSSSKRRTKVTLLCPGDSPDLLLSYINLMRGQCNLPPIRVSAALNRYATTTVRSLTQEKTTHHAQDGIVIAAPENLNHILSYHCNEMGMCVYTTPHGDTTDSFILQVFSINEQ